MPHPALAAGGQLRWHRPLLLAVRLLVVCSLALMVFLFTRLAVEDLVRAADRFGARHNALFQFDTAIDAGGPGAEVRQRLQALGTVACQHGAQAAADAATLADLGRRVEAYLASNDPAQSAAALAGIRGQVRQLDAAAESCMRLELDDVAAKAVRIRYGALALIAFLATAALGAILIRRSDQAQLKEQLRFNEQLIDALPLPLSLRSPQGRFMLVNRAFEEKHKVRREHLLGQPVAATLPRIDADAIATMDARAMASQEPVEDTFDIGADSGVRHVQVRVHALRRPDDSVIGTVGIQTDVTPLRRKEAQLTEINAKLGQLSVKMIDAQEDERRRIARDLHDQVGQILTALKLQLASLAKRERIDAPAGAMTTPIDLAEEALRHTRDLSASLHPHLLDDLGLEPALNWLIDRFIRPSVPHVELRCRMDPPRGPEAIELVAFRVVQEALTNVVRHAGATRVGVILEAEQGELAIEVIDDGVGFEAGTDWFDLQRSTSLGVSSMHDRVNEIGGSMRMDSEPESGTSVRVRLPWRPT
jgi:two-component system, NarL family, sensor histidine kinase UhpB